jgi:hypothetical protein
MVPGVDACWPTNAHTGCSTSTPHSAADALRRPWGLTMSFATVMGPPVCQGVGTTCLAQGASSWVVGAVSTVGFWRRR